MINIIMSNKIIKNMLKTDKKIQNPPNPLEKGGLEKQSPWDYSDIVLYKDELIQ
jgi:hypothetical protein